MVEALDSQDNDSFRHIGIWRSEVNISCISCACSAQSTRPTSSGLRKSFSATLTTRAGSLFKGVDGRLNRQSLYTTCSACGLPTDGVAYKRISGDEFGLVRVRGISPPDANPKIRSVEEGRDNNHNNNNAFFKKLSQAFRRAKMHDARTSSKTAGCPDDAAQDAQKTRSRRAGPGNKFCTEMYRGLECGGASDGEDDVGGKVPVISDDSRKKPKVGIEESVARLGRARKLLHKNA
ncbi:hypothetical protein F4808DRAFT_395347 [Astrocystis sublimbata]|nr:hypothetical protein F4808DRAFT_395347 [Astrocystis sublimbata]